MFWTRIAEVKREGKELPGKRRDDRYLMTWRTAAELIEMINSKMLLVSLVNITNFICSEVATCARSRWCTVN